MAPRLSSKFSGRERRPKERRFNQMGISRATRPALLLVVLSWPAMADDLDNVIFEGLIRDSAGAVMPGTKVVAINDSTRIERSATSDAEGRYRIVVTEPGIYRLRVSAPGFRQEEIQNIQAKSGQKINLDFTLFPAGSSQQVTVSASAPALIDVNRSAVGDTISSEIEELPLRDRNLLQLIFLIGGAVEPPLDTSELAQEGRGFFLRSTPEEAGIFSLTGAAATSNNITIDGLDNNDDRSARERIALNPESVAELQVITNQYSAEYGRASGGRINIRTRGGTNKYRGEAYLFFEDESLNANTFFRNARGLGRLPKQERRLGFTFSGPIQPNRHFFFASYERLEVEETAEVEVFVPVQTNPLFPLPKPNQPVAPGSSVGLLLEEIPTPEQRNLFNLRADFNPSHRHSLSARFDIVRGANRRGFPGGSRLPETALIEGRDSDSLSLSSNLAVSAKLINQARFQFSRLLPRNRPESISVGVVIESPSRIVAGSFTGSQSAPAFAREEKRAQIQDILSASSGGRLIKLGFDLQLIRASFADLFAAGGQYTFDSVEDFLANRPSRFIQRFNTDSRQSNNVWGIFVQGEWKARRNLMLSLGLRQDGESIIRDRDNFSPRASIAWDPLGDKKTVLRAGFGIFYNRALLRTIDDFSLGRSTLTLDSEIAPEVLSLVRFPSPADRPLAERFGVPETRFLRQISSDLQIPYSLQAGLGLERQLARRTSIRADYVFVRGAHLWRETNINAPALPAGFKSFTEYLLSRDFDNRPDQSGRRPITAINADIVRFDLGANTSSTRGAISVENGLRILTLGLNAPRSANIRAALAAIRSLRPNPLLGQVEQLQSTGNSFYHGGIFSIAHSLGRAATFRATYTLSKFIDEGTTNTASPQDLMDRRAERSLSLQDQRHRLAMSGIFRIPRAGLELAPIISFGSSKPFNIGTGFDRNLNDISNDRPLLSRPLGRPRWRRPGSRLDGALLEALALAPIGSSGDLPRNYGIGPGTRTINLRAWRVFSLSDRVKLRAAVDAFNLFNNTVFSFGAEFINRDDADFLIPRRTYRPRTVQLNLKLYF
jgi:hypothetical protein